MLKFYEIEGRFPAYREEVPQAAVDYLGSLVKVKPALFAGYACGALLVRPDYYVFGGGPPG